MTIEATRTYGQLFGDAVSHTQRTTRTPRDLAAFMPLPADVKKNIQYGEFSELTGTLNPGGESWG